MDVRRRAGWLPTQEGLEAWLETLQERVEREDAPLDPALVELQELLEGDPLLRMYAERMVTEEPQGKPYRSRHIDDLPQLLALMNGVLRSAPEFSEEAMVVTPMNAVVDWAMGTTAGFAAFRDPRVNAALKKVLSTWCAFLDSPGSRYVLEDSPSGWMSEAAQQAIGGIEQYEHDPEAEHWGFGSWNDFFTRRFRPGEREVAAADDPTVVVSPCESTPYAISTDVRRSDRFWVKNQSYSLEDMLAGDAAVDALVGGTVYQAYLSATNYHRWHSPVAGTVRSAFVVDGTYYSEADTEGAGAIEPQNSQGYMAHVATRAVLVVEADDPRVGVVAFVAVGMSDVSSCVIDPQAAAGRHVDKGQEVGYFQFGGSTMCLVLGPGVVEGFALAALPQPHDPDAPLVKVCSPVLTVRS